MARRLVITGASSAIGQAIARRLAEPGDHLVLHCASKLDACRDIPEPTGGRREIVAFDFRDQVQLDTFCAQVKDVDILINAAARTAADLLPNLASEAVEAMIAVNIRAPIALCRAVLPGMMAKRRGIVVNVSSIAASRGNRGQSVYAGTKGFVDAFTRSLAAEYGGRGIRVNAVAPGAIDAGSLRDLLAYAADEVKASTAAGRLGRPEDVAGAVAFLCSADASFINGKCLAVDGGFCRGV